MSKPNAKPFNLAQKRKQRAEKLGGQYVPVEGENGEVVQVPRMAFWDAETYEKLVNSELLVRDMATLARMMPPEAFEKLKSFKLQLGDVRELIDELMKTGDEKDDDEGSGGDVSRPEDAGSSTL